jgi:hypothetical protein
MHTTYYLVHIIYDSGNRYPPWYVIPDIATLWTSTSPQSTEAPISKKYIFSNNSTLVSHDEHIFSKSDPVALA